LEKETQEAAQRYSRGENRSLTVFVSIQLSSVYTIDAWYTDVQWSSNSKRKSFFNAINRNSIAGEIHDMRYAGQERSRT